jgi:hypothetical protein
MIDGDPLSRVLHIDLSRRRFWVVDRRDLFEKYVGGAGVAINLLIDECPRGRDPFNPENLLELGGEVLKAKYDFKMREGFDFKKLRIPKRILETATPLGLISENFIFDAIQSFASKMGF